MAISGYASVNRNIGGYLQRLGPLTAQAVVVDEGGSVGNVSFGRYSTIIKPVDIPTSAPSTHLPITYVIQSGDTLPTIAKSFGVTVSQLRWSNASLFADASVIVGTSIIIPPTPGVVVTVKTGETVATLATKYQVDPGAIMDYNRLRNPQLAAGATLVIPGGIGPAFPPPPLPVASVLYTNFKITIGAPVGTYTPTGFPYGWCTWYVATRRPVPWRGNAIEWYGNARAMGFPVGSQPRVGAIMVTTESPIGLGHVSYVEVVNADGSWVVSEMHYVGWGVTDQRLIKPGQLGGALIGFIYGFTP